MSSMLHHGTQMFLPKSSRKNLEFQMYDVLRLQIEIKQSITSHCLLTVNNQYKTVPRPSKLSGCTPVPLSVTSIESLPNSLNFKPIDVAPASKLFSISSFTAVAKFNTTLKFNIAGHQAKCVHLKTKKRFSTFGKV